MGSNQTSAAVPNAPSLSSTIINDIVGLIYREETGASFLFGVPLQGTGYKNMAATSLKDLASNTLLR